MDAVEFQLTFDGSAAEKGLIEFYDAAKALAGFQRSLALTTHFVLHGEVIVKAPSARGFQIFIPPFIEGCWKVRAKIIIGGLIIAGSTGKDSPIGHLVTSVYDAVLYNTMGFHVDYDRTLQDLYIESQASKATVEKLDSLSEKVEESIAHIHRPIVKSRSANFAQVSTCGPLKRDVGPIMNAATYEYVRQSTRDKDHSIIFGYVSSYNINTYKGRIFSTDENRPIPFELDEPARSRDVVGVLTNSQHLHGQNEFCEESLVRLICNKLISANGKVKRYMVRDAEAVYP